LRFADEMFGRVRDRLLDRALAGGELAGKLMSFTESKLEAFSDRTKEVLGKLLSGGGKGLVDFAKNLVRGVTRGFAKFAGNIKQHLQEGLLGWLKDALPGGLDLPKKFDLKEMLGFAKEILKLTGERVFGQLEKRLPGMVKDALGWAKSKAEDLVGRGPAGLAKDVLGALKEFAGRLLETAGRGKDWLGDKVGAAAGFVEGALEKAIPPAIDLLAGTLGLGGVASKTRQLVEKVRGGVERGVGGSANAVQGFVQKAADAVEGAATGAAEAVEEAAAEAAAAVAEAAADAAAAVEEAASGAADAVEEAGAAADDAVEEATSDAADAVEEAAAEAADAVEEAAEQAADAVEEATSAAADAFLGAFGFGS
jgi:hypothetical protein